MEIKYNSKDRIGCNKKGFTLLEVLISITILSILIVVFSSVMGSSINIFSANSKAYEIQSDVVYTSNSFNEVVRDSTAIFILNSKKYDPAKITEDNIQNHPENLGLTNGWNYIGLNNDNTKIYNFVWNEDKKKHIPFELTMAQKDKMNRTVHYTLDISHEEKNTLQKIQKYQNVSSLEPDEAKQLQILLQKLKDEKTVLRYAIQGKVLNPGNQGIQNESQNEHKSESIVQAINAKQIFDETNGKKATAIAYRTTPIQTKNITKRPVVAAVLDYSGSMWNDMNSFVYFRKVNDKDDWGVRMNEGLLTNPYENHEKEYEKYNIYKLNPVYKFRDSSMMGHVTSYKNYFYLDRVPDPSGVISSDGNRYRYRYKNRAGDILEFTDEKAPRSVPLEKRRYKILNMEFITLIEKLEKMGGADLYVIPFSQAAFHKNMKQHKMEELKEKQKNVPLEISNENSSDSAWLKDFINNMKPGAWTNYGDGARVGLEYLKQSGASRTYLMILSDGVPYGHFDTAGNFVTLQNFIDQGKTETEYVDFSTNYVKESIQGAPSSLSSVTLIGFSNVKADKDRLKQIKGFFDPLVGEDSAKIYEAGSSIELNFAFQNFVNDLEKDLWYFDGP